MRSVIFDLDGTLADTAGDLIAAGNHRFNALGYGDVLNTQEDAIVAGRGVAKLMTQGFERLNVEAGAYDIMAERAKVVEYYTDNIAVHTTLYAGAAEAIESLKGSGYAVGVCTNKPEGLAVLLLKELGVHDLFGAIVGADTTEHSKPHPMPYVAAVERAGGKVSQSFLVGDTITDRKTSAAAGVPSALVTFGPIGQDVQDYDPDVLLHHYDELPAVAKELIG